MPPIPGNSHAVSSLSSYLPNNAVFNVDDYAVVGDVDDGARIIRASTALQAAGGGILMFPPRIFNVYKTGQVYGSLGAFSSLNGIAVLGYGATLAQDPTRVYLASWATMFLFNNCTNVIVDGFNVTGPLMDITGTTVTGNEFVRFKGGGVGLNMPKNKVQGVIAGLIVGSSGADGTFPVNRCRDIFVGNLDATDSFYGAVAQFEGDNFHIAHLRTDTVHRSLFFYGNKNFSAHISSKDASHWDVLLQSNSGTLLENGEIWYEKGTDTQNSTDGCNSICLMANDPTPAVWRNLRIHLNIKYNATGQTGAGAVRITKLDGVGAFDQSDRGHKFENITFDGTIDGNEHYTDSIIFMDNLCKWGPGDFFSNIKLERLKITNNTRGMLFYSGPFTDPFVLNQVQSSAPLQWTPNDSAHTFAQPILIDEGSSLPNMWVTAGYAPLMQYASAANVQLTGGYRTKIVTNAGSAGIKTDTLEAAVPGRYYTFALVAPFPYHLAPQAGDIIRGAGAVNKYLSMNTMGASVTLKCEVAGTWDVIGAKDGFTFQP